MLQSNRLTIYAIGKIKKLWIRDGINQYKKRMPELIINELKTFNINNLRSNNNIIICLSEEGKQFNSVELCSLLLNFKNKKINFYPKLKDACFKSDLLVIHTEWNEFKQLNFKKLVKKQNFKIFDMRNLYDQSKMKKNKLNYLGKKKK